MKKDGAIVLDGKDIAVNGSGTVKEKAGGDVVVTGT